MIIGSGAYRDGKALQNDANGDGKHDFEELAQACSNGSDFVWVGLLDPSHTELESAGEAFGIHPLAVEDAGTEHERPKLDVGSDSLTVVIRPARYDDDKEIVEFGQLALLVSPRFIVVVRHGGAVELTTLRSSMEADPEWLRQGPGAVMHAIIDAVVDAYLPVISGITDDIAEVESVVFSASRESPTQRIYELKREVIEFSKAATPLVDVLHQLSTIEHPILNSELRRYFSDISDQLRRVIDQSTAQRELLTSALEANLTQVSIRQNEDMRKMSAWVAILAVPTMIAGIYGMNFTNMPELESRYGYFVVLGLIAVICSLLYRSFRRSGWL
ncbi:MAG: magnesium/cobalt transporter CorA [Microthrixaceae bacterium]